jgi:AraC-like DNA-binding protein
VLDIPDLGGYMLNDINLSRSWRASSPPPGAAVWPRMTGYLKGGETSKYSTYAVIPANYYCPHIVAKGKGFVRAGKRIYPLIPGDMFCIWAGRNIEYWGDPEDTWNFYWLHLCGDKTKTLLEGWGFSENRLVFRPKEPDAARRLFTQIHDSYYDMREEDSYRIIAWLYELGAVCQGGGIPGKTDKPDETHDLAREVLNMIKNTVRPDISVSQAAEAFGVSRSTLFRAFKDAGLKSPVTEMQAIRIEKAKQILSSSNLKISDTAGICGFHDEKYFMNAFKKFTGKSPGAWRRENSKEGNW